jgi:hypothetical protein
MTAIQSVVPSATIARGLPALIAGGGDRAALRFPGFFTVNIHNRNTRAAHARAAVAVRAGAKRRGLTRSPRTSISFGASGRRLILDEWARSG